MFTRRDQVTVMTAVRRAHRDATQRPEPLAARRYDSVRRRALVSLVAVLQEQAGYCPATQQPRPFRLPVSEVAALIHDGETLPASGSIKALLRARILVQVGEKGNVLTGPTWYVYTADIVPAPEPEGVLI